MSPEGKLDLSFLKAGAEELANQIAKQLSYSAQDDSDSAATEVDEASGELSDLGTFFGLLGTRIDRLEVQARRGSALLVELQMTASLIERSVAQLNEDMSRLPRTRNVYFAALLGAVLFAGAILVVGMLGRLGLG